MEFFQGVSRVVGIISAVDGSQAFIVADVSTFCISQFAAIGQCDEIVLHIECVQGVTGELIDTDISRQEELITAFTFYYLVVSRYDPILILFRQLHNLVLDECGIRCKVHFPFLIFVDIDVRIDFETFVGDGSQILCNGGLCGCGGSGSC